MEGNSLGTSSQFDTFGFTATEVARKQAENEQKQRSFPMLKILFIDCWFYVAELKWMYAEYLCFYHSVPVEMLLVGPFVSINLMLASFMKFDTIFHIAWCAYLK